MTFRSFLSKVKRRIRAEARFLLSSKLPWNTKYRPLGVVKLSALDSDHLVYHELHPPYISTLQIPDEFVKVCAPSLKPEMTRSFGADFVAVVKKARLYVHGTSNFAIISSDNLLIDEASFQWDGDRWVSAQENKVMRLKGYLAPKKIKGRVCSLLSTGGAKNYYYFWVNDLLPKIHLLKKSGEFEKIDFFYVPSYAPTDTFKFQKQYLDYFGIKEDKILIEDIDPHIEVDELVFTSPIGKMAHYPKWGFEFVQRSLCGSKERAKTRLIYISRMDARINRPVLNEEEVINILKGHGFEILLLTKLGVEEQALIFNTAKVIVAAHGAGLTNLVYCQPGVKVLEMFPSNYVRHGYYDISNKMQLEYDYMLCQPDRESSHHSEGQRVGLTVDVSVLKEKLAKMLA